MSNESKNTWTDVLGLVQRIAPTEGWAFTTSDLIQAGLEAKEAAKWLTKFVDWGYIRRGEFEGDKVGIGGRPRRLYHMLERGLKKDVTAIGLSDTDKLLKAILRLREQTTESGEKRALADLFKVTDEVIEARESRLKHKS
jgi:hypothetical protein